MRKPWIAVLVLVFGGLVASYLFQIQLMFWAGNPYSWEAPWKFLNIINSAALSVETELPWHVRRIRANLGDPFALADIVSIAGRPGPQSHGLESTPGDQKIFLEYKAAQKALVRLSSREGLADLQKILLGTTLRQYERDGLVEDLPGSQSRKVAPALQELVLRSTQPYHVSLSAAASRALARANDLALNAWLKLHRVADVREWADAAKNCDEPLVRTLPNPDESRLVLHYAVTKGCINTVRVLLQRGSDPNMPSGPGFYSGPDPHPFPYPMDIAATHDDLKMADLLASRGAVINWYAVVAAAGQGHLEMVKWLIAHGAEPPLPGSRFDWDRMEKVHYSPEIQALLDQTIKAGQLRQQQFISAIQHCNRNLAQKLIAEGASVDQPASTESPTPLQAAFDVHCWDLAGQLIERSAWAGTHQPYRSNSKTIRYTPLMLAAAMGPESLVRTILERKPDPDAHGPNGWTALMFAARRGHAGIARQLMTACANPAVRSNQGLTAGQIAYWSGYKSLARQTAKLVPACANYSWRPPPPGGIFGVGGIPIYPTDVPPLPDDENEPRDVRSPLEIPDVRN